MQASLQTLHSQFLEGEKRNKESHLCILRSARHDKDVFVAGTQQNPASSSNVAGANFEDMVEDIIAATQSNNKFKENYVLNSMFLIGQGAFGLVFRAVTQATGSEENPRYPVSLVKYLQRMKNTSKLSKNALMDSYRDEHCLDLVAIKFEQLIESDIETNAVGTVHLIREFYILQELFSQPDSRYSMVGFPMPIDFDYIGNNTIIKDLDRVIIFDPHGVQNSFKKTYLEEFNIFNFERHQITDKCYFTMELVGPNLDQWKDFFMETRGNNGHLAFTAQTVLKLMDQVLCRLIVMHRKKIVHLDLKPDNICMGIGKMCNTVYLVDYGLSKICSDNKPDITLGTRRYMSLGVLNLEPANFIMDIESWFYVLLALLCDHLPWSDTALEPLLSEENMDGGAREEKLIPLVGKYKRIFWGEEGLKGKRMWQAMVKKIEQYQAVDVPDIGIILSEIYEHIKKMKSDFHRVSITRMHADIRDEESDLFKRYRHLRKLLLYPYECDFMDKGSCFINDKDLLRRQSERREKYKMLTYAEGGRNWHWDWDEWYTVDFDSDASSSRSDEDDTTEDE